MVCEDCATFCAQIFTRGYGSRAGGMRTGRDKMFVFLPLFYFVRHHLSFILRSIQVYRVRTD